VQQGPQYVIRPDIEDLGVRPPSVVMCHHGHSPLAPASSSRLAAPVHVSAVLDHMDKHVAAILTDLVNDSVIPPPSNVQTLHVESQGFAYPSWLQRQRAVDELDDRRADLLREVTQ
jgi:hypothetical protein